MDDDLAFFNVLKNNLKCRFCEYNNCTLRYMPERIRVEYFDGMKIVTTCKKNKDVSFEEFLSER